MPDVFGGNDLAFEDVEEVDDPNDDDFEWDDEDESVADVEDEDKGLHTGYVNAATVEDTFRCSDIRPECRRTVMVSERC